MEKNNIYIDLKCIKEDLSTIAFNLFKKWTKNATKKYPNNDFTIVDERILVNDLIDTIRSALISLAMSDKSKKSIPDWSIGFLIGFISSNLNTHWVYEYIVKPSQKYKRLLILKIIRDFFNLKDAYILSQLSAIFQQEMLEDVNLKNLNLGIEKKDLNLKNLKFKTTGKCEENEKEIIQSLNNMINETAESLIETNNDNNFIDNIDELFNDDVIKILISKNKYVA